jgi:hypothetical protein
MVFTEIISLVALVISLAILTVTLYFNLRDKARVVAKSTYYPGYEGATPHLAVHIVNAGRRSIVIRLWVGANRNDKWVGTSLNDKNGGHRLAEYERYDFNLWRENLLAMTPDEDFVIETLWLEDTLGRRYIV